MKRLIFASAVLLSLSSCSSSSKDVTPSANGSWTFSGTNYPATTVKRNNYALNAVNGTGGGATNSDQASVVFKSYPTSSGSYKLVGFNVNGGQPANDNEVTFAVINSSKGGPYYSSPYENKTATVTVTNGKVHIVVPEVWATTINNSDSARISGDLMEP